MLRGSCFDLLLYMRLVIRMARPSRQLDLKLIQVGKRMLPEVGVSGMSVRRVAQKARVNLGMFHYHFGSRDEFIRRVLQDVYEDFFSELSETWMAVQSQDPVVRLRCLLLALGDLAIRNRRLVLSLLRDIFNGETLAFEFVLANLPRHLALLKAAIEQCQAIGAVRADLTVEQIIVICASTMANPGIVVTALERLRKGAAAVGEDFLSPEFVQARVEMILHGLQPHLNTPPKERSMYV